MSNKMKRFLFVYAVVAGVWAGACVGTSALLSSAGMNRGTTDIQLGAYGLETIGL